jgi:hypothetical protein
MHAVNGLNSHTKSNTAEKVQNWIETNVERSALKRNGNCSQLFKKLRVFGIGPGINDGMPEGSTEEQVTEDCRAKLVAGARKF